jgi:hypothetical protein
MQTHIAEALQILQALGMPKQQQNERSALTLLAIVNVSPEASWADADNPLIGITPMMDFFARKYGKQYQPNTRETVRRQTVHQFLQGGLITMNPDAPTRPINSPHAVYQIETSALQLLRTYGTNQWEQSLGGYLTTVETLQQKYTQERQSKRISVPLPQNSAFTLSPGGQNILIEQIVNSFLPHFAPGGKVIYIGDADEKFAFYEKGDLAALGIQMEEHGKMPDVIIYDTSTKRLILMEAVTSHGPINAKRQQELLHLFQHATIPVILITAFLSRKVMNKYFNEISWETEIWCADAPSHMIHLNGDKFLAH